MKKILRFSCFYILFFGSLTIHGQTVSPQLDTLLRRTLDSMKIITGAKSLSAAIQFSDNAIWAHAKGVSSASQNVTPNDAYLIGSVTKTLTSACILKLADEGLLHLDDSLHQWLDTMPFIDPNITIRQLLQHTSGLYDVLLHPHNQDSMMANISRIWTPEELIERFMNPPLFAPGTSWSYCNTNYFLLGMIIKEATGNPFYTELRNRFFTPLGLNSFAIPAFETLTAPVAHVWLDITGDGIEDDANNFYMSYKALNSSAGAAGGYFATPTDCTKWMRTYMRGDVISAAMMTEAQTTVNAQGSQGGLYGLGMMKNQTDFLDYLAYGHSGDLAYHASSWYFPEKDASITVMTNDNSVNSWALIPVVRELLRTYQNYLTTSVSELQDVDIQITPFPNPFKNQFSIKLLTDGNGNDIEITLKDILGRTINCPFSKQYSAGILTINFNYLSALQLGIYFTEISKKDKWIRTLKMIKE